MEIITEPLVLDLHGFSGTSTGKDHQHVLFGLMNRMWQVVKSRHLQNKGRNIWIYEPANKVFAGVELESSASTETELESKKLVIGKYAQVIHVGAYNLIGKSGEEMKKELIAAGHQIIQPYLEIYGHWNVDETKLETALIRALE
jgi:hypothetical protein